MCKVCVGVEESGKDLLCTLLLLVSSLLQKKKKKTGFEKTDGGEIRKLVAESGYGTDFSVNGVEKEKKNVSEYFHLAHFFFTPGYISQ